jgi:dihydroneopterin aldolase
MQRLELKFKDLWVYIGIYDYERLNRQPVHLNLKLCDFTLGQQAFIDYQLLQDMIIFTMEKSRFYLLEDACAAIAFCLRPIVNEAQCDIAITKSKALVSAAATVGLEVKISANRNDDVFERENLVICYNKDQIKLISHGDTYYFGFGDYIVRSES